MLKNVELRDYQKKILNDLKYVPAIGLFMGTGTGKTLTSLARFEQNKTKNLLVICPQKIITQWWEVLEKHTDLKPLRYKLDMSAKNKNKLFEQYLDYEDDEESDTSTSTSPAEELKSIDELLKRTKAYTLKDAVTEIKNTVNKLENKGFDIRLEEMDFENTYQVIIRIEKDK